jgi:hypothetical protein
MVMAGEWQAEVMVAPMQTAWRQSPGFPGIEVHGEEGALVAALVHALKFQGYHDVRPVVAPLEAQHSKHELEVWIGNPN